MSWIEQEIESIKQEKDRRESARQWSLHKADFLRGRVFQVWSPIVQRVKEDVSSLDSTFKGEIEFIEAPARAFTVKKKSRPAVEVTASIRPDGRVIELHIRKIGVPLGITTEKLDVISIDIDESENISYLYFATFFDSLEEVSRIILAPILSAYQTSR